MQLRDEGVLESAETLDAISHGVADGITIQDVSGRVLYANDAAARLSGFPSAEAFLAAPLDQVMSRWAVMDEQGNQVDPAMLPGRRALQGEEAPEIVLRVRDRQTEAEFWRTVSARPIFDGRGQVRYAVNVIRDVTRLKQAELDLSARARQQEVVAELGQRALGAISLTELFDEAVRAVAATLQLDHAAVMERLPDGRGFLLRAGTGWDPGIVGSLTVPADAASLAGYTMLSDEPVIAENLGAEHRFDVHPTLVEHGLQSSMSVLIEGEDEGFGVLSVHSSSPRRFTEDDIHFLQSAANVLGATIQRRRVEGQLRDRVRHARSVHELGEAVSRAEALEEIYQLAIEGLGQTVDADRAAVLLVDSDGVMRFKAWRGLSEDYRRAVEGHSPWTPGESRHSPVVVEDALEEPSLKAVREAIEREGVRGIGFIPLEFAGRLLGKLMLYYDVPHRFTEDEIQLLQTMAGQVAFAIERKRGDEQLLFQKGLLEAQSEASIDGILVVAPDGTMVSFNRRFVEMWDMPDEVVASRSDHVAIRWVQEKLVNPDEFRARIAYLYDHPDEESRDEILLRDGRTFDRYSAPVKTEAGQQLGRVWFFKDVTTEKLREKERTKLLATERGAREEAEKLGRSMVVVMDERAAAQRRLVAQYDVARVLAEADSLPQAAPEVLRALGEGLGWEIGAMWRVDEDEEVLRCVEVWRGHDVEATAFEADTRDRTFGPGVGLPGRVWAAGEPAWIPDVASEGNFPRAPVAVSEGLHAAFGFPVVVDNEVLGVVEFFSREIRQPDEDLLRLTASLGSQVGQFVQRREAEAEREEALRRERAARNEAEVAQMRLAFLAEAGSLLSGSLFLPSALGHLARLAVGFLSDVCVIDLVSEDGSITREAVAHVDPTREALARELKDRYPPHPLGPTPAARVIRTGRSEWLAELTEEFQRGTTQDERHLQVVTELGFQSYMCVPLSARGRILGALTLVSTDPDRRYGPEDVHLAELLAGRAGLAIDNARLYRDRDHIARTLQRSLLPRVLPEIPGVEVAARYQPAGEGHEAGGDFYDVIEAGENAWTVIVGDVCGKGAEAAAVMGLARYTIRALAMHEHRPSRLLGSLNSAMLAQVPDMRFCTACCARLRISPSGDIRVTVCLGGHPKPLVLRSNGTIEHIGDYGSMLGVFSEVELHDRVVDLGMGDIAVLYTDGLESRRIPLADRLRSANEGSDDGSASAIADRLLADVAGESRGPDDDVALLVLRVATDNR